MWERTGRTAVDLRKDSVQWYLVLEKEREIVTVV